MNLSILTIGLTIATVLLGTSAVHAQDLDERVKQVLAEREGTWRDWNIPTRDGQVMFDLIVANDYTNALEIGTSTGHSTIWIAWALSKTGGRLTTIEIDERRQQLAKANIEAAGLTDYVEFILGDAHQEVPAQPGPLGFVFSDADKDWYTQYFKDFYPKLTANACVASHNVTPRTSRGWGKDYLDFLTTIADMGHTDDSTNRMLVTCKFAED